MSFIRRYQANAQGERIETLCPGKKGDKGRHGEDNRRFVDGVLWIARSGAPWRALPDAFGTSYSQFQHFLVWAEKDVWEPVFDELRESPDDAYLIIDAIIVRARQRAAGARRGWR